MNAFNLFAKLTMDKTEYEQGLDEAKSEGSSLGSALATGARIGMGAITAMGTAIAGAGTAIAGVTRQAVDAYADYEQLAGGIETLFTDANGNVEAVSMMMENASNAWKTAGLSANEYMETAIESSAAMVSAVGGNTAEASRLMDMSITDMADNVNKMGTTMESIQNAYRGFSRGNFTMLDNLALGFAGTKDGMQELLDKAQEVSGIEYDIESYADIVQAIHVVQEEMGIAGTTAKEANETISGSLSSMKSAWQNLITGFADPNADLGALIGNVTDSVSVALGNLMPAIEQSIGSIASLIENIAPIIADKLPTIIQQILPSLLNASTELVTALVQALPDILNILVEQIPILFDTIIPVLLNLLPQIIEIGMQFILALAMGLAEALPDLMPTIVDVVLTIVNTLIDNVDLLIDASIALIIGLATGLINALPRLVERIPEIVLKIVSALIENVPKLNEAAKELIVGLARGLVSFVSKLGEAALDLILAFCQFITDQRDLIFSSGIELMESFGESILGFIDTAKTWGHDLINNFIGGIKDKINDVVSTCKDIAGTIADYLGFSEPEKGPLSNFHTYAPDMIDLFTSGIEAGRSQLEDTMNDVLSMPTVDARSDMRYALNNTETSSNNVDIASIISEALRNIMVQVRIGDEPFDDMVSTSIQRTAYRSGGRG